MQDFQTSAEEFIRARFPVSRMFVFEPGSTVVAAVDSLVTSSNVEVGGTVWGGAVERGTVEGGTVGGGTVGGGGTDTRMCVYSGRTFLSSKI